MKRISLLTILLILLFSFDFAFGQSISLDHVDGLVGGDPSKILVGETVVFHLRSTNDTEQEYINASNGFRVYSDDDAVWGSFLPEGVIGYTTLFAVFHTIEFGVTGSDADTVGFGCINFALGTGIQPGYDQISYTITIGPFAADQHGKTVCLDSSFFPPGGTWKWCSPFPVDCAYPEWDGPHCYTIHNPVQIREAFVDIKPQACPNPMSIAKNWEKSKAVLPVAILGDEDFDVTGIDPASIMLEGVAPLRWSLEDVSTPLGPDPEECECNELADDGYVDLTLKFRLADVVATLGEVEDGDVIPLTLTGSCLDGTQIEGVDCVIIRSKGNFAPRLNVDGSLPTEFALSQNYPNPFNPTTEIGFALPEASNVLLEVYNVLGQKVSTLMNGYREAGYHSVAWDGSQSASGIYLYRITTDYAVETKKMLLLK